MIEQIPIVRGSVAKSVQSSLHHWAVQLTLTHFSDALVPLYVLIARVTTEGDFAHSIERESVHDIANTSEVQQPSI